MPTNHDDDAAEPFVMAIPYTPTPLRIVAFDDK